MIPRALPSSSRSQSVAAAGALAVCTLAALLLGSVQTWQWLIVEMLGFLLLVPVWFGRKGLPWSPLLLPLLAFGALVTLQWCLRWSVVPSATLTALVQLAGGAVFFYLGLACLDSSPARRSVRTWAYVVCGVLAVEALLQYFTAGGFIYWFRDTRYGSPFGPFVNRDDYAGFIELLLPLAIAWVAQRSRRAAPAQVFLYALVPCLAVLSVLVSRSRTGAAVVVLEALGMMLWLRRERGRSGDRPWLAMAAAAALVTGALALGWQPLLRRFASLHQGPEILRWQILPACWAIFRHHWATGSGFGTFTWIYPKFQIFDSGLAWPYAHNDYAQALAETGLVGAACILAFLVLHFRRGWTLLRRSPQAGTASAAAFIGTLGLLVHGVLDFEFHIPANCYLFFLLVGMVAARTPDRRSVSPSAASPAAPDEAAPRRTSPRSAAPLRMPG